MKLHFQLPFNRDRSITTTTNETKTGNEINDYGDMDGKANIIIYESRQTMCKKYRVEHARYTFSPRCGFTIYNLQF